MPSDSAQHRLVLEAIVLVHNFRTTVFNKEYVWCKNLHGYDRIAQYYFHPGDYNREVHGIVDGAESDKRSNNE